MTAARKIRLLTKMASAPGAIIDVASMFGKGMKPRVPNAFMNQVRPPTIPGAPVNLAKPMSPSAGVGENLTSLPSWRKGSFKVDSTGQTAIGPSKLRTGIDTATLAIGQHMPKLETAANLLM